MTIHATLGKCTAKYTFDLETQNRLEQEAKHTGKTLLEVAEKYVGLKVQSVKRTQHNPLGAETF